MCFFVIQIFNKYSIFLFIVLYFIKIYHCDIFVGGFVVIYDLLFAAFVDIYK